MKAIKLMIVGLVVVWSFTATHWLHAQQRTSTPPRHPWIKLANGLQARIAFPRLHQGKYLITAYAHLTIKRCPFCYLQLRNQSTQPYQGLMCKVWLAGFSEPAMQTVDLAAGQQIVLKLCPTFLSTLGALVEQRPATIRYEITDRSGKYYLQQSRSVILTARNDVFINSRLLPFMAVCVTPNDRLIDELIALAADKLPGRAFAGYQKGPRHVLSQIWAIYITLAELGLHYRSATSSFLSSSRAVFQKVYFPAESLLGKGANCIDATCLLASVFEKLGLNAYLVFMPKHALVAVDLSPNKAPAHPSHKTPGKNQRTQKHKPEQNHKLVLLDAKKLPKRVYLETTLLGSHSFLQAVKVGLLHIKKEQGHVRILALKRLRQLGISPFPFPVVPPGTLLKLPDEKIFEIRPWECRVAPREFKNGAFDGPPEIFLRIYKNNHKIMDTRKWVVKNSFHVNWAKLHFSFTCRFKLHRSDFIRIVVYDRDISRDDTICSFKLRWLHFIARTASQLKTSAGTILTLHIREIH